MRQALFSVSLVISLTLQVSGQQPPLKTTTTGVVVDVTVGDAKGNPVLDLTPDEFELSEDGVRQRIVSVTLVRSGATTPLTTNSGRIAKTPAPAGEVPESDATPATGPDGAIAPSVTAILFDRLSPESRAPARRAALAYVATLTPPHDYAGVFLADLSFRTAQPFTNRRENLARAVDLVAGTASANTQAAAEPESKRIYRLDPSNSPTQGAESAGGGFGSIAEREHRLVEMQKLNRIEWMMYQIEMRMLEDYQRVLAEMDGQASLAGLRTAVNSMGALPGRKSILYFTEKLPLSDRLKPKFEALIGEANRANITIYPVDAVGLRVHSTEAQLSRDVAVAGAKGLGDESRGEGGWTKELEKQSEMLSSRPNAVLGRLAKETGGFLLENTNDLGAGVARMQQERTTYYLLAYQPTNAKLDGKFRKVMVKVRRSKVTVRARPGYIAAAQVQ